MPNTNPPRFNVIASNIHTGVNDTHGPYTGHPRLTYDTLHSVNEDTDELELIFQFIDPQDIEDREYNPHDYDQWEDSEGRPRYDGWRRLTKRHRGDTRITYYDPDGPFYTDLCLVPVE